MLSLNISDRFFFFNLKWKVKVKSLSRVRLFATSWTAAHQVPPSMGFSRQEYWSGLPFPFPGYLPNQGIEPRSPAMRADTLTSEPPWNPFNLKIFLIFKFQPWKNGYTFKMISSICYCSFRVGPKRVLMPSVTYTNKVTNFTSEFVSEAKETHILWSKNEVWTHALK